MRAEIVAAMAEAQGADARRKAVLDAGARALLTGDAKSGEAARRRDIAAALKAKDDAQARARDLLEAWLVRLAAFRVLDPACGSGNFLYVALHALKDLELKALVDFERLTGMQAPAPRVGLAAVRGIEIDRYAAELARVTLWIGDLQWTRRNYNGGWGAPILSELDQIENRDALLNADGSEAQWPEADVIIGNPPFVGGKKLRENLGDAAVERLFAAYDGRVPREADLVAYWVEKAWRKLSSPSRSDGEVARSAGGVAREASGTPLGDGRDASSALSRGPSGPPGHLPIPAERGGEVVVRAGLVTTNSIRGGANRRVLDPIAASGALMEAWPDEPWAQEGAAVRVSMIGFGAGFVARRLNGAPAARINADLTSAAVDLTKAVRLKENAGVAFMGDTKGGAFDIPGELAREWLRLPLNPNGRPNSDVLKPWRNGMDVTRRPADKWIIDFGWTMSETAAALYEAPFRHVLLHVKPERDNNSRDIYRKLWWRHVEARQGFWEAMSRHDAYLITPRVATHRLFAKHSRIVCPDSATISFAKPDEATFGLLQSRVHELWALSLGTSLDVGNDPRYTPSTTFETFPFPEGLTPDIPAAAYADDPRARAIAAAAAELDRLREAWLNPPDLVRREPEVVPGYPDRILPIDEEAAKTLKTRTLTNLYNQRPAWLANAHRALDAAVAAAYGWTDWARRASPTTRCWPACSRSTRPGQPWAVKESRAGKRGLATKPHETVLRDTRTRISRRVTRDR